jgi:hypothetical protein
MSQKDEWKKFFFKDHADHQAPILDVREEVNQKYKKLEVSISKLEEKSDFITKTSKGARI